MYVKRRLGVGDLMPAVRIVGKIGVSDFKKCFSSETIKNAIKNTANKKAEEQEDCTENQPQKEENGEHVIEKIGFEVVMDAADVLLTNIPKCEKELYGFLASMCELSVDEFKNLPPSAFLDVIYEIATSEEAKDFFSHVSRLMNLMNSDSGTSYTEDTEEEKS